MQVDLKPGRSSNQHVSCFMCLLQYSTCNLLGNGSATITDRKQDRWPKPKTKLH